MAVTLQNGTIIAKDTDGNIAYLRSLSAADIEKIKSYFSKADTLEESLSSLSDEFEAFRKGATRLAFADYSQSANQGDMEENIIYLVPFNSDDEFILFDESTYAPATEGNPSDTTVAYVHRYIKVSGTVVDLGIIYTQPDFESFATLAGDNEFTGSNTFDTAPTLASNDQTVATVEEDQFVTGKVVDELQASIAQNAQNIQQNANDIDTLEGRADALESRADALETKTEELEEKVDAIENASYLTLKVQENAPSSEEEVEADTIVAYPADDLLGD